MIISFYFALILLLVACCVLIVLFFIMILDSFLRGHDLPTSKRARQALLDIIKKYKPNAKIFYDLGCAHGDLALSIKKARPDFEVHGIDDNVVRVFVANLKSKILGRKINFKKQNIFDVDLSRADIVYCYLWYDLMPRLEQKLQSELKSGAIVVTNTTNFPNWQPMCKIITYPKPSKTPDFETLFVYIKQ